MYKIKESYIGTRFESLKYGLFVELSNTLSQKELKRLFEIGYDGVYFEEKPKKFIKKEEDLND